MKKSDLALLIIIVGVSLVVSYFAGQYVMQTFAKGGVAKVEQIDKIDTSFTAPSRDIFNVDAINPTVPISTSSTNNTKPIGQ